jgi:ABC-2 type transport system ATP-binding protein
MLVGVDADGLVCADCGKAYGSTQVLHGVSLRVRPGEVVGLAGPNGAGKTTLLHAIVGLNRLDSGSIRLDGVDTRRPEAKARMAFMPDNLPRPQHLTAREVIYLVCKLYRVTPDPDRVQEFAETFDIAGQFDQQIAGYSHGMSRKVDLIAALLLEPDLLVLDEPFSGLDPTMVAALESVIRQRREQGGSTLLSSHDLELAADVSDRIVMLHRGVVIFDGSVSQLLSTSGLPDVRSAFRELVEAP